MTEAEWLECTDPAPMLESLREDANERQLRLFACACCRRVWHYPYQQDFTAVRRQLMVAYQEAVDIGEQFADCHTTLEKREAFFNELYNGWEGPCYYAFISCAGPLEMLFDVARHVIGEVRERETPPVVNSEQTAQAILLRDIFGYPFRRFTIDPRWLTSTVIDLANSIYSDKAFDRMPILADALMDAGCDSEEIISHCRGDGPHVRGCWVVDLLTERQ